MGETFAAIEREHGLISVLFNNAGVYHDGENFLDATPEGFDQTLDVNLRVPFFATQLVAKRLIAEGQPGAIVNTASLAGQAGSGVVDYGAAKAALINFTKSAARALGKHGIRVNAIAPGVIDTAMGRRVPEANRARILAGSALGRIGEPEEIANVVNFLASDEASYITGATIDVNGGT
jgi:3-oxoacyl-[acyl-carrier protein] reductase